MDNTPRYATLRDYLRVLREHRVLIALAAIVFAVAGLGVASRQEKKYAAAATLSVTNQFRQQDPAITADRVNRLTVAKAVKETLHTNVLASSLQHAVSARVESKTELVIVEARWTNPRFAARIANGFTREVEERATEAGRERSEKAVAAVRQRIRNLSDTTSNPAARVARRAALKEQIAQIEAQAELAQPIEIVRFASVPGAPVSPKPVLNTLLGLVVGLTLGILAAFVRDALDRRLRRSAQIQEHLGLPLLGHLSERALGSIPGGSNGGRRLSEQDLESVRILRVNLDFVFDPRPRSVAVTSGLPEEGKSTVAISLATVSATGGRRTLLVECDLRRPSIARRLGIAPEPGLTQYLDGLAGLEDIMQEISLGPALGFDGVGIEVPRAGAVSSSLVCVTAGRPTDHPADVLGSPRFGDFLREVGNRFEFVVLDTAPLLSVVDTRELLPHVDGVLLCVRAARTTDDEAKAAKQALEHLPDRPTALVVTGVRKGDESDYGYYSYAYTYEP